MYGTKDGETIGVLENDVQQVKIMANSDFVLTFFRSIILSACHILAKYTLWGPKCQSIRIDVH